jgi:hypothetical protein
MMTLEPFIRLSNFKVPSLLFELSLFIACFRYVNFEPLPPVLRLGPACTRLPNSPTNLTHPSPSPTDAATRSASPAAALQPPAASASFSHALDRRHVHESRHTITKKVSAAIDGVAPLGDDVVGMSSAGEWVFSDEQLRNTPSQRLGLSQV